MAEELQETSQEESTENNDSLNVEEEETTDVESDDPYASKTVEDFKALEQKNKELYSRAKTAEALAKELKSKPLIKEIKETPTGLTREEAILIAKGVNEDIINQASLVAKAKGVTLMDAMKDPLIEAYASKIKADEKREKAQLGTSKSGGSRGNDGDFSQVVGMTEEEHRKRAGF